MVPPQYTYLNPLQLGGSDLSIKGVNVKTLYQNDELKLVLFHFAKGQQLKEHSSNKPVIIQILEGTARLTLKTETLEVSQGAWLHLQPNLNHSVTAVTSLKLLLTVIK